MPGDDFTPDDGNGGQNDGSPTEKVRLHEQLDLSEEVLADAIELYEEVSEADTRKYSEAALPVAALYIAIREHGVARNIDEVAEAAGIEPTELYRTAQFACTVLGTGIPPADSEIYVARLAEETGLDPVLEERAFRLLSAAKAAGYHSGRKPEGLAAAAINAAIVDADRDSAVTQQQLVEITDVTVNTIRRGYKEMLDIAAERESE